MCSAYRVLYLVALILCSAPAFSAVTVEAVRVGSAYSGPSNQKLFDATLKTTSTTPGVPAKYVTRAVPLSAASAARLARGALGGPLGLAVTAAMVAQGLIVDNDTGEIVGGGEWLDPSEYGQVWRGGGSGFNYYYFPTALGACSYSPPASGCGPPFTLGGSQEGRKYCNGVTRGSGNESNNGKPCGRPSPFSPVVRVDNSTSGYETPSFTPSDADVAGAVPDDVLRDLINDLLRRRPQNIPTVIPELASEMEATKDAQEAAESHASDPSQNPAPTPEEQDIVDSQTTTEPTFSSEWPAFCSWASVVCDFIDWMREPFEEPDNVPLPMLDIDIPDYDSNLPSVASCPAPVVVNTQMWGSFELSYQPFCDLAEYIRYGVLGIAYLFAAYTIIGVRR